jgi:hypothetical protein
MDLIVRGLAFLLQLTQVDPVLDAVFADFKEQLETRSPEQSNKNWQAIGTALFDHGLELPVEAMFAILAGRVDAAIQLAIDIHHLRDRSYTFTILQRVGPELNVRQRVHPFLGVVAGSATSSGATAAAAPARGAKAFAAGREPTRILVQDPQRFAKKRGYVVDQVERLREREVKAMRLRERKEREAAKLAAQNDEDGESAAQVAAQELYMRETLLSMRNDPSKVAEKKRKTELLKELERMESQYTQDERRLTKMRREQGLESPRGVAGADGSPRAAAAGSAARPARLQPIREVGAIPFAAKGYSQIKAKPSGVRP